MSVASYYDKLAADYHKQYDGTAKDYPANAIRLKHIISRLKTLKPSYAWEIGVGEGTLLVEMAKLGIGIGGCDISKEMVKKARANLEANDLYPDVVIQGDSTATGDIPQFCDNEGYDVVIATGVLPHTDDNKLISDIYRLLKPGGSAIVEFRNSLFSLFTFNRYTIDFVMDEILKGVSQTIRDEVFDFLMGKLGRNGRRWPNKSEFDKISRFHNPFVLQETFAKHGFQTTGFIWYHAHPAMPYLEEDIGEEFRKEALKLEKGDDWRGMFMCSAGLIEVKK